MMAREKPAARRSEPQGGRLAVERALTARPRSEVKPHGELDDPGTVHRRSDKSKGAPLRWKTVAQGSIGIAKSGAVEDIEHVAPDLRDEPFVDSGALDDPKVLV